MCAVTEVKPAVRSDRDMEPNNRKDFCLKGKVQLLAYFRDEGPEKGDVFLESGVVSVFEKGRSFLYIFPHPGYIFYFCVTSF